MCKQDHTHYTLLTNQNLQRITEIAKIRIKKTKNYQQWLIKSQN